MPESKLSMRRGRFLTLLFALAISGFAGGCATLPEGTQRSEDDPWERYNRSIYQFNDAIDSAVLRPVAQGYDYITPEPVERSIGNFFDNLSYPVTILNQFLQGKFGGGFRDVGRFVVNTTIGFAGLFDPATELGLESNEEDFGQTLAVWGAPRGPYIVLPFFGPSSVRGTVGLAGDISVNPVWQTVDVSDDVQYSLIALNIVHTRAQFLSIDEQLRKAYDPYTFLRDAYLQRREFQVYDGNPPQEQYDDLYDFEDLPPPPPDTGSTGELSPSNPPVQETQVKDDSESASAASENDENPAQDEEGSAMGDTPTE